MPERPTYGGLSHLRQRSTTAVVLSRPDPRPGRGETVSSPSDGACAAAGMQSSSRFSRWLGVLTWVVLGAAIAALWALLLLGDSLVVSG
jgi:hypothetical protein